MIRRGRTSSLWGWWNTGTGRPEKLWILLLWRYSRPAWTRSSAACSRCPCFSRGPGLDDPQRSLPTPNILWFCEERPSNQFWILGHCYSSSSSFHLLESYLPLFSASHYLLQRLWSLLLQQELKKETGFPDVSANWNSPSNLWFL